MIEPARDGPGRKDGGAAAAPGRYFLAAVSFRDSLGNALDGQGLTGALPREQGRE